jgi:hypothetical protein
LRLALHPLIELKADIGERFTNGPPKDVPPLQDPEAIHESPLQARHRLV